MCCVLETNMPPVLASSVTSAASFAVADSETGLKNDADYMKNICDYMINTDFTKDGKMPLSVKHENGQTVDYENFNNFNCVVGYLTNIYKNYPRLQSS